MIFLVPGYWIINLQHQTERSIVEGRDLTRFSLEELGLRNLYENFSQKNYLESMRIFRKIVSNKNIPVRIEEASRDQFPFRPQLIRLEKAMERAIITLVYLPLEDNVIPISFTSDIYIIKKYNFPVYSPNPYTPEAKAIIDQRIENYQTVGSSYPKKNFYIYFVKQLQFSDLYPSISQVNSAKVNTPVNYFKEHKPASLLLGVLDFRSLEEYMDSFYKTDGHWNNHGVLIAYYDVYSLLSTNYPDISDPVQFTGFTTIPDLGFLGYIARSSYYPFEPEPFELLEYSIPEYKVLRNGAIFSYNHIEQYLNGEFSQEKYANHYGDCFGYNYGFLEFVSEGESKRNILVIGDSFDNPLLPILTAHYKHLYSVDLRHNDNFRLADFFATHHVDDVLVIGGYDVVFGSKKWAIPLN